MIKKTKFNDCVGIHFNLTEGIPLTDGIRSNPKFCTNGEFIGFPNRNSLFSARDKKDVYNELTAQIQKFISTGLIINHVDSHHHIHNAISVFPIVLKILYENNCKKIRIFRNAGHIHIFKRYIKNIYNYY